MFHQIAYSQVKMEIELEKKTFYECEEMQINLKLMCADDAEGCILDDKILERVGSDIPYHFVKLDDPAINKGFLVTDVHFPMGRTFFYLPSSSYLVCQKTINLKDFELPEGDYELKFTLPAYKMPEKVDKTNLNEYKTTPCIDPIVATTVFHLKK